MAGAIAKIEVDQILIREARFGGQGFEVSDRIAVETYCDGLFQPPHIWILLPLHFRKIIMISHGLFPIIPLFVSVRFASGNDSDYIFPFPITMAHNECAEPETQTQKDKAILVLGMIRIGIDRRSRIIESRLCLLERDSVLAPVRAVFPFIPFEPEFTHTYIVRITK